MILGSLQWINGLAAYLCSDGMSRYFMFGRVILAVDIAVTLLLLIDFYFIYPPKEMARRYRWSVFLRLYLPSKYWHEEIRPEDIPTLTRFRNRSWLHQALLFGVNMVAVLYFAELGTRALIMLAKGRCGS